MKPVHVAAVSQTIPGIYVIFSCQVLDVITTEKWGAIGLQHNRDVIQHRVQVFL